MVNKGFPSFGASQAGAFVSDLKNYNLPEFILSMVAKECKSALLEKGRIDDRLQSMNDEALELLHRVFVDCEHDEAGRFAQYRFYAYVSSMYHKSEVAINEQIPGVSGRNHRLMVAVKNNGMYVAVATNKATGRPVSSADVRRFCAVLDDIKKGDHGTMLADAVYGSSVGFRGEAITEMERIGEEKSSDPENALDLKAASFENNIYSIKSARAPVRPESGT